MVISLMNLLKFIYNFSSKWFCNQVNRIMKLSNIFISELEIKNIIEDIEKRLV